ncbi:nucleoporin protein Ndc1-Nup [Xylariales sp. PMI_506]|nr:nucleoporin protein Ndc1-Nup [Xylariales sp. PMI_506]
MAPPVVRRAPYKDFLQPAMQRRFASALLVLLAVAYLESVSLSRWDSIIWSWFPIGLAGIRTFAIFGCALFVVVLRIAHPHVGLRTSNSPFDTFRQNALSFSALETIATYALSAFFFSQVYLFAVGDRANLQWITYHSGDRARLNERAVFYTVTLVLLGAFEGFMHLFLDYDRLLPGIIEEKDGEKDAAPAKPEDPMEKLVKHAPRLAIRSITNSLAVALASYVLLYKLVRSFAWGWTMAFFRPFFNLPKTNIPPAGAPWSIWMLGRCVAAGTLLCLLWNVSNAAFTFYLAKQPVKNGQPLTSESKDPNGSLLNGLKSKKPRIASFAMWELALIARDFPVRRKAVFEDIDRKDGPMWSQVYKICLDAIKQLETRVDEYGKPPAPPPPPPAAQTQAPPRIVEPPLSANVWQPAPPPKTLKDSVGKFVADVTNSPGKKPADSLVPLARKAAMDARNAVLTQDQQAQLNKGGVATLLHPAYLAVSKVPFVGWVFRQTYSHRYTTAVLGTPYGDASLCVNAAFALSRLAVASLDEDSFGNVQRDVQSIVRTLTTVIKKIEIFGDKLPTHWTDEAGTRASPEIDGLLNALKEALARVVTAFEPYSASVKLGRADLRLAKEAAQKKAAVQKEAVTERKKSSQEPEMVQVG